ncbi:response regulator [Rhodospirillum sp. A1_3_36]|uniref:response regulator n=1 Tax=Rhodospirillum sp. A1_3_36 TaxID=3391666 RepID=UPI0039A5FDCA
MLQDTAVAQAAPARAVSARSALIIDDHPLYCDALASMMEMTFGMRRVRKAASMRDALTLLRSRFSPDLVVLDLGLPDVSGLSGFMKIKSKLPDVPVVVISAVCSEDVVSSALSSGAAGFISKDLAREGLEQAMMDVWEGKTYVPAGFRASSPVGEGGQAIADVSRRIAGLSQQQARILALICEGKPNKLIAYEMDLAEATVKAHITALLRRLNVQNRTQAALMVREVSIRHRLQ